MWTSPCLWHEAAERTKHLIDLRAGRMRARAAKLARIAPEHRKRAVVTAGMNVFILADIASLDLALEQTPVHVCRLRHLSIVTNPALADIFVCVTPGSIPEFALWSLTLNGGVAVDVLYFATDGANGSCVSYTACVKTGGTRTKPRFVWCSAGFRSSHPELFDVLRDSVAKATSVWRICDTATFSEMHAKFNKGPVRQHRPWQAFALVEPGDDIGIPKSTVACTEFVDNFSKLNAEPSVIGTAGL